MRTTSASPKANVATPTTMAVRIKTWGKGLEYVSQSGERMGAVPPRIFSRRNVKQIHRGLENRQAYELLNHVAAGDDNVQPGHDEEHGDPMIDVPDGAKNS